MVERGGRSVRCFGRRCEGRMRSRGGGTRGGTLAAGARGYTEAPPTRGRRGLLEVGAIRICFLLPRRTRLAALQAR